MKSAPLLKLILFLLIFFSINDNVKAQTGPPPTYNFYAYNEAFNYLSGGTVVSSLTGIDDGSAGSIPIGFNFLFAGANYSQLSANTNGWISLNNFSTTWGNDNPNLANLTSFGPCLLPMWEDLSNIYGTISYATTGTAPNRVFTLEYKNSIWDYLGTSPCISFQVRLYEGGVIKFHYKQESGAVNIGTSYGCSIGIGASSTSWQFLNSSATTPTTTSTSYTPTNYEITTRPATGQVYQFGDFPCNAAPTPVLNSVTSTTANISWSAMFPSLNYEYALTTSATPPATGAPTTALTYNATGLTPGTNYYFHIRNICNATQSTVWISIPVTTNPPCIKPTGLLITDLTINTADIEWRKISHALGYIYAINKDRSDPTSTTPTQTITDTFVKAKQLEEGVTYYIHIKVNCPGGETSEWLLDSFTTLILCRPPKLNVEYQHIDRGLVYWDRVPSAVAYEYEVSQSPTPLGSGTEIQNNSFLAFPLKPGEVYYFHARSKCIDKGFHNISDWITTSFRTFALSVSSLDKNSLAINAYPNPVKDILNIEIKSAITDADAILTISDITGKLLYTIPVGGNAKHEISMNSLASGVYTIRYTDKIHTETTRVTKQ